MGGVTSSERSGSGVLDGSRDEVRSWGGGVGGAGEFEGSIREGGSKDGLVRVGRSGGSPANTVLEGSPSLTGLDALEARLGSIVPIPFSWNFGGHQVSVTGAWDQWTSKVPMHRQGNDFSTIINLPLGRYQYKFVVDGEWRVSSNEPTELDEHGNVNNVIEVVPHVSEFELTEPPGLNPPLSPVESYDFGGGAHEEYGNPPPSLPPHYRQAVLDSPLNPDLEDLGTPRHVALQHLCSAETECPQLTRALGLTQRYKNKFVTTVFYVPASATF
eukprot:CAMPEP_0184678962 /NCGR_PEP_ID=MMETSP0312-20130426/1785_1 /TAXON_ID=31354 /ORGANISM="Compsopogon coeruleus, Strain SAG 36.94" /LENGTH=271 /DNA_ID=CAMNT_0027128101 /DNA_START=6 /DNA_END=821 /DNA_ORIENTATION=-